MLLVRPGRPKQCSRSRTLFQCNGTHCEGRLPGKWEQRTQLLTLLIMCAESNWPCGSAGLASPHAPCL